MKKFKNLESYDEATQYIKTVFEVPVSQMELEEAQEEEIIAKIIGCLITLKTVQCVLQFIIMRWAMDYILIFKKKKKPVRVCIMKTYSATS